ncbi:hypothetical protein BHE74_00010292 [Ensete ventricosum]|nr:hypothetical protein GW17_00007516 [Ensete ventricosum]RWW81332.1 hypothetical protein BHE74_00010292 [Ensete ventricosum]RZR82399.1 hypothetical protein BHM03_00008814 [Ensete ventricosum]
MSSVYVLEPPTKGKVVLQTTAGPLDIELWPREAPKAVRNFVQLCLEGYYDRTIFHRIIKGFLVQGGDPTATGTEVEKKNEIRLAVREALTSNKVDSIREHEMDDLDADDHSDDDDEANFDARMRLQILKKRREMGDVATHEKLPAGNVCYLT